MRKKPKKLLITTERHELFIVHHGSHATVRGFCPKCGDEVDMLTLDSAISISSNSGRDVIKQIAAEEIHSIEAASGHLLICKRSLELL